jgi:hypothetical protein
VTTPPRFVVDRCTLARAGLRSSARTQLRALPASRSVGRWARLSCSNTAPTTWPGQGVNSAQVICSRNPYGPSVWSSGIVHMSKENCTYPSS